MPSLLGSTVATNYGRMVSTENYTESGSVRTYTGPFTQFGTRELKFLKVVGVESNGSSAVDFSASYTTAGSDFQLAVRAIQTYAEIYAVGTPDSTGFIVIVAADTANGANSGNTQGTGYGLMEAAVTANLANGGSAATTITELTFDGVSIA